jgi:hypothetical protein
MRAIKRAIRHEVVERRNGERVNPKHGGATLRLLDGRDYAVSVENISESGAAVTTRLRPAVGSLVKIGDVWARVIRHSETGIALEFSATGEHGVD